MKRFSFTRFLGQNWYFYTEICGPTQSIRKFEPDRNIGPPPHTLHDRKSPTNITLKPHPLHTHSLTRPIWPTVDSKNAAARRNCELRARCTLRQQRALGRAMRCGALCSAHEHSPQNAQNGILRIVLLPPNMDLDKVENLENRWEIFSIPFSLLLSYYTYTRIRTFFAFNKGW